MMMAPRRSGDSKLSECVASTCYLLKRRLLEIVIVGAWVALLVFLVWTLASQHNPAFSHIRTARDDDEQNLPGHPAARAVFPLPFRAGKHKPAAAKQKGASALRNGTKGKYSVTAAPQGKQPGGLQGKQTTAAPFRAKGKAKVAAAGGGGGDVVVPDVKSPNVQNVTKKGRKQVIQPKRRNVQPNPARPHRGRRIVI